MRRLPSAASVHDAARNVLAAWERAKASENATDLTQLDDAMEQLRSVVEAPPAEAEE